MDGLSEATTTRTRCPACQAPVTLVFSPESITVEEWRRPLGGVPPDSDSDHTVTEACPACRERVEWAPPGVLIDLWSGHGPDPDPVPPVVHPDID